MKTFQTWLHLCKHRDPLAIQRRGISAPQAGCERQQDLHCREAEQVGDAVAQQAGLPRVQQGRQPQSAHQQQDQVVLLELRTPGTDVCNPGGIKLVI